MQAQWDWSTDRPKSQTDTVRSTNTANTSITVEVLNKIPTCLLVLDSQHANQLNRLLQYILPKANECVPIYSVNAEFRNDTFHKLIYCPDSKQDTLFNFFTSFFRKKLLYEYNLSCVAPSKTYGVDPSNITRVFIWVSTFEWKNYPSKENYVFNNNIAAVSKISNEINKLFTDSCEIKYFNFNRSIQIKYLSNGRARFLQSEYPKKIDNQIAKIINKHFYWDSAYLLTPSNSKKKILPNSSKKSLEVRAINLYSYEDSQIPFRPKKNKKQFTINISFTGQQSLRVQQIRNWRNPIDSTSLIDTAYYAFPQFIPSPIKLKIESNKIQEVKMNDSKTFQFMLQKIKIHNQWQYYFTSISENNQIWSFPIHFKGTYSAIPIGTDSYLTYLSIE